MLRPQFILLCCVYLCWGSFGFAQSNIHLTNPAADAVLHGNYNPAAYAPTQAISDPMVIAQAIQNEVSADSLQSYIEALGRFHTRNSGSDTVSQTKGIGAARRWAHQKLAAISQANENRLLTGYLQFDRPICGAAQHRNVVAVLPGLDTSAHGFVLVEAHLDSRCATSCDTACIAHGAEDNGSGCALVLELARVMSRNAYRRTVVFMLTTAEEQGLYGAQALNDFCLAEDIPVHAVLNNDVVGGVICGHTSSPPSCPGIGDIDSLNLRLFSYGGFNSLHKQLARYNKLQYKEVLRPWVSVPMTLHIMSAEDRTGRGGDHIPFRQGGFKAMRFTCANEHGNGSAGTGYTDHQHTSADSLGLDADLDGDLDSLWIDFHYLARNTAINANAASMIALGPETPDFAVNSLSNTAAMVEILSQQQMGLYRVAVRTVNNDWDTVYTFQGLVDTLTGLPASTVIYSVASVDAQGTESLFSYESATQVLGLEPPMAFELLPNRPNPFDEKTIVTVLVNVPTEYSEAHLLVTNVAGEVVQEIPITLEAKLNEVMIEHGYHASGVYFCSLVVDGKTVATGKMVME